MVSTIRQIGSFPQGSGWKEKIFELPPPSYPCLVPPKHRPKSLTTKWSFLVGKPMVVGYHHFRKPPYIFSNIFQKMDSVGWFNFSPFHLIVEKRSHPLQANDLARHNLGVSTSCYCWCFRNPTDFSTCYLWKPYTPENNHRYHQLPFV